MLVLSQFYEEHYALDLIGERAEGVGYLLKERVGDVEAFIDAVARVAAGGSALDPEVVGADAGPPARERPLDGLSPRERDVLAAMAEGKSNQGIAEALVVTEAAVEKHVTSIFHKLELGPTPTEHRRVLAVLTYLRDSAASRRSASWRRPACRRPGGLSTRSLPSRAASRSSSPSSRSRRGAAPPTPSSRTSTAARRRRPRPRPRRRAARECLTTFVSASATTKYAVASTARRQPLARSRDVDREGHARRRAPRRRPAARRG